MSVGSNGGASAQDHGPLADYARAERFLSWNVRPLIHNVEIKPRWIGDSDRFWYLRTSPAGKEFILVEPAAGERTPAFDHVRLADALSRASGTPQVHNQLPFDEITFVDDHTVEFALGDATWRCDLAGYTCAPAEPAAKPPKGAVRSPNGQWDAFVRGGNLYVRPVAGGDERQLTDDAEPYYDYATLPESRLSAITDKAVGKLLPPAVLWSPDSKRLLTYRLDQRTIEPLYLVQSVPPAGSSRPVAHAYRYPLPGDSDLPAAELLVFDLDEAKRVPLGVDPLIVAGRETLFEHRMVWWSQDGTRVYVLQPARSGRAVALYVVDAESGAARKLIEETGKTTVMTQPVPYERPNVRHLEDGSAAVWYSTRSGWGHLYLYDGLTGELRGGITSGAWTVREIVRIDEQERRIYFTAGGREEGRDPYERHLYRCKLDGSDLELLTPEDADHSVTFAPSGSYFVDSYSRVDLPTVTTLRTADGRLVATLETADISGLLERGWRSPERFSVKARDGVTDLYGMIIRPSDYDSSRRYPVLDAIYPGPQIIRTPKAFPAPGNGFWQDQALAELGFIVVTVDGMGTPYRSKRFLDVAYGANFGEAGGLADHVAALKQLGGRDPSMDLDRVGIYGHSGGGYASTRALLLFPDFYKVAVSSAGNHDQLGYNATWGEHWIGPYDAESYATQDNIKLAGNLRGKLLLVHGEMDDNVHPSLTLRLVDALIAAEKDFDLLIIPNTNHGFFDTRKGSEALEGHLSQGHPYFIRKRWEYFARHLLGVDPPAGYRITMPSTSAPNGQG